MNDTCGATLARLKRWKKDREFKQHLDTARGETKRVARFLEENRKRDTGSSVTIDVVVHVITYRPLKPFWYRLVMTPSEEGSREDFLYDDPVNEIPFDQIQSAIEALNRDFGMKNSLENVPGVFRKRAVDTRIKFRLATTDPRGNWSPGFECSYTDKEYFMHDDYSYKKNAWDYDKYLNIWVVNDLFSKAPGVFSKGDRLYGKGIFPSMKTPEDDGVTIVGFCFGTRGIVRPPLNQNKTLSHEVGHWLDLEHLWGDETTNYDDFCEDTPPQEKGNLGVPQFPHISTNKATKKDNKPDGDMFMNFMDYSDDAVLVMFTQNQVDRMHATLSLTRTKIGKRVE
jgi:hypothetical protein